MESSQIGNQQQQLQEPLPEEENEEKPLSRKEKEEEEAQILQPQQPPPPPPSLPQSKPSGSGKEDDDEDDDDDDGDDEMLHPLSAREYRAREEQRLLCYETIQPFVDPTLFRRLIVPSAASVKRRLEEQQQQQQQQENNYQEKKNAEQGVSGSTSGVAVAAASASSSKKRKASPASSPAKNAGAQWLEQPSSFTAQTQPQPQHDHHPHDQHPSWSEGMSAWQSKYGLYPHPLPSWTQDERVAIAAGSPSTSVQERIANRKTAKKKPANAIDKSKKSSKPLSSLSSTLLPSSSGAAAKRGAAATTTISSAPVGEEDPVLGQPPPPPYMYSWEPLELGTRRGSAAYNAILRSRLAEQSGGHHRDAIPQLTPIDLLDLIRCTCPRLPRTVLPPYNSPIVSDTFRRNLTSTTAASGDRGGAGAVVGDGVGGSSNASAVSSARPKQQRGEAKEDDRRKKGHDEDSVGINEEDKDEDDDVDDADDNALIRTLRVAYESMVAQDAAPCPTYYTSSPSDVLRRLHKLENDHATLQMRETRTLERSKLLGLDTAETRLHALKLRGAIPPDDVDRRRHHDRLYRCRYSSRG
jgi:hypothetical protein